MPQPQESTTPLENSNDDPDPDQRAGTGVRRRRMSLTDDLRKRVVDAYKNGMSVDVIATAFGLPRSTAYGIIRMYQDEDRVESKKRGRPHEEKLSADDKETIKAWIDEDCSITLRQIAARLLEERQISVSEPTISRCIKAFHYTLKRITRLPERRNDETTIEERAAYAERFFELMTAHRESNFFFFDEVGFAVSMRSVQGRSLIGTRAVKVVPNLRTRNFSIFAVKNKTGLYKWISKSSPYNTAELSTALDVLFECFINDGITNVTLICDNVPFHRAGVIREKVERSGHCLVFLPPYSPFLNPIENLFSKWKGAVRNIGPQNEEQLISNIENCVV